jgi:peroxiredoxin
MAGPAGLPLTAHGQEDDMPSEPLKVGDPAPDFEIPSTVPVPSDGSTVSVRALTEQGQAVVIAFFPKAFTSG